jgi:oxygen-independent coproporphyrinogen-3 oxidase
MIDVICLELKHRKNEIEKFEVESIYFGGGTPSLLAAEDLKKIMDTILQNYVVKGLLEVTLEANPDDITGENLRGWKVGGIDRLSVGIQSFKQSDLEWMNRAHNVDEANNCVALAKSAGFSSFSVDLIYGLPALTLQEWESHIQNVIDYGVAHISAYCLTVEEKTALANKVKTGEISPADEDAQAEQFEFLVQKLKTAGYEQYEVSNFCLPGKEAIHNSGYWKGSNYIGIGPSAHSFDGKTRRFNVANNAQYMNKLEKGEVYYEIEGLSENQRFNELILTGIRTKWGVSKNRLTEICLLTKAFNAQLNQFKEKGWLREENGTIFLQGEGWLMADHIASELFISEE